MIGKDVFSINVPTASTAMAESESGVIIADGCSSNTNYYTTGGYRGTCCCGCDKDVAKL